MEREYEVYRHLEFETISRISVSHLYNLRRSNTYRGIARRFTMTKPVVSRIGERVKPDPKGRLGYIRVDTVHQGEIVASVERISEAYLVLALESMLAEFSLLIRGFHLKHNIGLFRCQAIQQHFSQISS
jgi:hypothetical protein